MNYAEYTLRTRLAARLGGETKDRPIYLLLTADCALRRGRRFLSPATGYVMIV